MWGLMRRRYHTDQKNCTDADTGHAQHICENTKQNKCHFVPNLKLSQQINLYVTDEQL